MFRITMRRSEARIAGWWAWSAAVVAMLTGSSAMAAPTVLDFEDLPPGTTVTAQYGPRGVLFQFPFLDTDPAAHSGTRVLRSAKPSDEIFEAIPLPMTFTSPQARVKLFAESVVAPLNGTLIAFDASNNIVAQDGPKLVAADVFTTVFEVIDADATPSITRAELRVENSAHFAIDDLEFEGEPPAPQPTEPPTVTITTPTNGADLDVETIDIAGTVTGEGLLSSVRLTIEFRRPPETTAPPFGSDLDLTGTGTTRQFSLPGGFGGVPMGPITITVEAENSGGLKGSASVTINNLPAAIRDRMLADLLAGAPPFGSFSFGLVAEGCRIAVFSKGAVSVDNAGVTHVLRGDILTKWLSLRGAFDNDGIGCPLGEERDGPGESRVQDFQGGRIFANLSNGTAFVPTVFVDVIDKRGVEFAGGPETTVPVADPVSPVEPVQQTTQTWLYQQFIRPDRLDLLPCTLEIRGTPPRIWIERQSGILAAKVATLWEDFPCSSNLGPCTVDPPQEEFPVIEDAGDRFCGGEALSDRKLDIFAECVATEGAQCGGGEWQHIKADNYIGTPIFGVVTESALAGEDWFASHEWFYNCPFETVRPDCPSDWTLIVDPIGPHRGIGNFPSLFAAGNSGTGNSKTVELEYERFFADFVVWMGRPAPGDLIYAVGRWIIDCGHDTFKSELHPVYMYSKMKTVTGIIDPFTGLPLDNPFGGQPATQADVWVNGWYPGGDGPDDAIEFDIYPPPRPSPTATLVVNKPVDDDAVHEISIQYSIVLNHVHVKFTAPRRENHVDKWGQVKWEVNRGYEGQWYVYWHP